MRIESGTILGAALTVAVIGGSIMWQNRPGQVEQPRANPTSTSQPFEPPAPDLIITPGVDVKGNYPAICQVEVSQNEDGTRNSSTICVFATPTPLPRQA